MCRVPVQLRELVKQRLAAAAEEIFALVEKTLGEYEAETERRRERDRALLEQLLQPRVLLSSPDEGGAEAVGAAERPTSEPPHVKEERDGVRAQVCGLKTEQTWTTANPSPPRQTQTGVSVIGESGERISVAVKTERGETMTPPLQHNQTLPPPPHTQTLPPPPHNQTLPPLPHNQTLPPPPHTQTLPPPPHTLPPPPHTQTLPPPPPGAALLHAQAAVDPLPQDVWTEESLHLTPPIQNPQPPQPWPCPGPSAAAAPVFPPGGAVLQAPTNPANPRTQKPQKPQKRFHCTLCPKSFASNFHLVSHTRVHTGERPFQCPVCEKGFRVKGNLDQHMMIHYDLRPFSCTFCGKSFSQKSNLNNHLWVHSGLKPFSCSLCGKRYRQRSSLSLHMASH